MELKTTRPFKQCVYATRGSTNPITGKSEQPFKCRKIKCIGIFAPEPPKDFRKECFVELLPLLERME